MVFLAFCFFVAAMLFSPSPFAIGFVVAGLATLRVK